jgi:glycine dehydrogenase subunit 1
MKNNQPIHPYIPNSAPATKKQMLAYLRIESVDELFSIIPEALRLKDELPISPCFTAEGDMRRYVEGILNKNTHCLESLNFRGGGCWQHYVPAVCDEILSRGEFLTAYTGSRHANLGSFQAQFEYQSMMAELVGLDVVSYATYDWGAAASSAIGMAQRITGRHNVLMPANVDPQRREQIQTLRKTRGRIDSIDFCKETGQLDLEQLENSLGPEVAAVYIEVPSYLGNIEPQVLEIAELPHKAGALLIVGADPMSLGILEAPGHYGADMVCGSIQPLGIHMFYGGGLAGYLAMPDDEVFKSQCPWPMLGLLTTDREGEYTYGWVNFDTTPYQLRDRSDDFIGTGQTIWAIVAGVYLTLMGPRGMQEIGETIMQRNKYAAEVLGNIPGITAPVFTGAHFKEFVVRFDDTSKSVKTINSELKDAGIFGGIDLSSSFPDLGKSALYCITEVHNKADIDHLVNVMADVVK